MISPFFKKVVGRVHYKKSGFFSTATIEVCIFFVHIKIGVKMSIYKDWMRLDWGTVKYTYGQSVCARCGKKDTLDKMIWSDIKMSQVCYGCADIKEVAE